MMDTPHGEFFIIESSLAVLLWRQAKFTSVVLFIFSSVHLICAVAQFLGWRP